MKPVIGVMGPSRPKSEALLEQARRVGVEIARSGAVLLTGATTGCSLAAAEGARSAGGMVVGISPVESRTQQTARGLPLEPHDVIVYTGLGSHARNALNIRSSDAVIFVGISSGTLNEFTVAFDLEKPLGILAVPGAELYGRIAEACARVTPLELILDSDPSALVARLLGELEERGCGS